MATRDPWIGGRGSGEAPCIGAVTRYQNQFLPTQKLNLKWRPISKQSFLVGDAEYRHHRRHGGRCVRRRYRRYRRREKIYFSADPTP